MKPSREQLLREIGTPSAAKAELYGLVCGGFCTWLEAEEAFGEYMEAWNAAGIPDEAKCGIDPVP
jgi:hypothetical protein